MIPDKCNYDAIMVPGLPEVCSLPFPCGVLVAAWVSHSLTAIPSKDSIPRAIKKKAPLESEFPLITHSVVIKRNAFLLSEPLVIFSGYWVRKNLKILTALTFPVAQQIILLWDSWASQALPLQALLALDLCPEWVFLHTFSWKTSLDTTCHQHYTHFLMENILGCYKASVLYTTSPWRLPWMLRIKTYFDLLIVSLFLNLLPVSFLAPVQIHECFIYPITFLSLSLELYLRKNDSSNPDLHILQHHIRVSATVEATGWENEWINKW